MNDELKCRCGHPIVWLRGRVFSHVKQDAGEPELESCDDCSCHWPLPEVKQELKTGWQAFHTFFPDKVLIDALGIKHLKKKEYREQFDYFHYGWIAHREYGGKDENKVLPLSVLEPLFEAYSKLMNDGFRIDLKREPQEYIFKDVNFIAFVEEIEKLRKSWGVERGEAPSIGKLKKLKEMEHE